MFNYAHAGSNGTEAALIALDECGHEFARNMLARLEANADAVPSDYLDAYRAVVTAA